MNCLNNILGNPLNLPNIWPKKNCNFFLKKLLSLLTKFYSIILFLRFQRQYDFAYQQNNYRIMQRNYDFVFKIVLMGPSATGKTSLLRRYADDQFEQTLLPTIGVDFKFKSFNLNGDFIKLQLWDTAGQQKFRSIVQSYYKDADAIIFVCDVHNALTLQQIQDYWVGEVKKHSKKECQLYLFANKSDDSRIKCLRKEDVSWCEAEGIRFIEVSAKTGRGVQEGVNEIVEHLTKIKDRVQNSKIVMSLNEYTPQRKKKSCC